MEFVKICCRRCLLQGVRTTSGTNDMLLGRRQQAAVEKTGDGNASRGADPRATAEGMQVLPRPGVSRSALGADDGTWPLPTPREVGANCATARLDTRLRTTVHTYRRDSCETQERNVKAERVTGRAT